MAKKDFLIPIGQRIASIRRARGFTQETMADLLSVSPKHISHVECGTSSFSLEHFISFARITDCSLDFLILGNQNNDVLNKIPSEIYNLLNTGTPKQIELFQRYLQLYIELNKKDV